MALQIYNVLNRDKIPFEPLVEGKINMYVCGPTVQDFAHLGHAKNYVSFDIMNRYLRWRGYDVLYVQNITDVGHLLDTGEDRILKKARQLAARPMQIVETYTKHYFDDMDALGIMRADISPRASAHIPEQIKMTELLLEKGHAYEVNGSVYFDVRSWDDYGKLSNRRVDDQEAGTREAVRDEKRNPEDFALWKGAEPEHILRWDSPWGEGFPGWHIECSTMSLHYLGEQIDIHGGGNDLIFPHHENEIAQTESLTDKHFARYWVHNGMLQLEGEKMSKSIGNVFGIHSFLERYSGDVLRMLFLGSGYRNPLTYNEETLEQSQSRLDRIAAALKPARPDANGAGDDVLAGLAEQIEETQAQFVATMDDDFNTAGALGHMFDLIKRINQARDAGATDAQLADGQETLRDLCGVFGLTLEDTSGGDASAEPFIDLLVEIRQELRQAKQWALSDKIRDELSAQGIVIEDTSGTSTWHWDR